MPGPADISPGDNHQFDHLAAEIVRSLQVENKFLDARFMHLCHQAIGFAPDVGGAEAADGGGCDASTSSWRM